MRSFFFLGLLFTTLASGGQPVYLVNNSGKVVNVGYAWIVINGHVVNLNGGTFDNTGYIALSGDWENNAGNGAFVNSSPGKVILTGDTQTVKGSDATIFHRLELQGAGVKKLTGVNALVEDSLILNDREFDTDTNTLFVLKTNADIITRTTGFVSSRGSGSLSRNTDSVAPYLFPTGSSDLTPRYRPVEITPLTIAPNTFTVRMANTDATTEAFDRSLKDSSLCLINPDYYHRINHTAGTGNADIAVYYDTADGNYSRIAHWQNTPRWENTGVVNSVSKFGMTGLMKTGWGNFTFPAFALATQAPVAKITAGSPTTFCQGGNVSLTADTAVYYAWSTGETIQSITVNAAGVYVLTTYNSDSSCTAADSITVTVNTPPSVNLGNDTAFCQGGSVTLDAGNPGSTYLWQNGNTTQTLVADTAGLFYVFVTDVNNCSASDTANVTVNALPVASISGVTSICQGDSTVLTAGGGISFSWSTGATTSALTVNPAADSTYSVTVTDANGCSDAETALVKVNPPPVASVSGDSEICLGKSATLTASGGVNYLWNTGSADSVIAVSPSANTTYFVTVSVGTCSDEESFVVAVNAIPVFDLGPDVTIILGEKHQLSASASGGVAYNWSPVNDLSCSNCANPVASPASTTKYAVTVTDTKGCTSTDSITITVEIQCDEIFVPNIFSPNGDGTNDKVSVMGTNCIRNVNLQIYDRWGEKVFETSDKEAGWNGTYKGNALPSGVYVYFIRGEKNNGDAISDHGNITLIR